MAESILDRFKEQYKQDKLNENYDLPEDSAPMTDAEKDEYKKILDAMRNDENDLQIQYQKFHEIYKSVTEAELKTDVVNPMVAVKRAYCPECGREIISKYPVMYDGFTGQKIVRYDCECGAKFNLEHSYPRVMFLDDNMQEMKVWTD